MYLSPYFPSNRALPAARDVERQIFESLKVVNSENVLFMLIFPECSRLAILVDFPRIFPRKISWERFDRTLIPVVTDFADSRDD